MICYIYIYEFKVVLSECLSVLDVGVIWLEGALIFFVGGDLTPVWQQRQIGGKV
jgi:hypothetical protein